MASATRRDGSARANAVFNVLLTEPQKRLAAWLCPFACSRPGDMQGRGRGRIQGMGDVSASEVGKLRTEVERLRRELDHVLRAIGQEQDLADQPRTEFLTLDA